MAKKVGQKKTTALNLKRAKLIIAQRSPRSGAYTFKSRMVSLEKVDTVLASIGQ